MERLAYAVSCDQCAAWPGFVADVWPPGSARPPSRYLDRVKQLVDEARLETKCDQVHLLCHSGEVCCGLRLLLLFRSGCCRLPCAVPWSPQYHPTYCTAVTHDTGVHC
jgi:hypothetical protein